MAILSTFGAMTARGFGWLANLATGAGLYAWGEGNSGQLGQGSLTGYSSPVQVGTLTTWSKASAGQNFAAAIKTDGTLYMWGANSLGQLGLGDTTRRSSPVQVGALTTWATVFPKSDSTHAIKTDGTLWSWGNGDYGGLGVGNTTSYSSPVQVGALTTWASANKGALSYYQTVAIKTDGTLWAWGAGTQPTGGNSSNSVDINVSDPAGGPPLNDRSSPVQLGTATNWARSACGGSHTLAITTSGALYAWGAHKNGQCGTGTVYNNPAYYAPTPTYTDFCVFPNYNHYSGATSAVEAYDAFYANCSSANVTWTYVSSDTVPWGYSSPVQVGALTTWSQVAGGNAFSVAVKTDGTLWSWGYNGQGQLGTGNTTAFSSPVQVGALTTWANVFAGIAHTVAIKTNGTLWAWGYNLNGQLGQGNTTDRSSPVQVGTATNWLSTGLSAGGYYTMVIRS